MSSLWCIACDDFLRPIKPRRGVKYNACIVTTTGVDSVGVVLCIQIHFQAMLHCLVDIAAQAVLSAHVVSRILVSNKTYMVAEL